jgi:hypothetical protein
VKKQSGSQSSENRKGSGPMKMKAGTDMEGCRIDFTAARRTAGDSETTEYLLF